MTIFGFRLWDGAEETRIRDGQRRIADAIHGLADDLEAVRRRNAAAMGLDDGADAKAILPAPRGKRGAA